MHVLVLKEPLTNTHRKHDVWRALETTVPFLRERRRRGVHE